MVFARRAGEHNIIYQYYLVNAKNHYMGLIQTETVCTNLCEYAATPTR